MEGQGMRDVLRQMRPDKFDDLIAAVATLPPRPDGQHPRPIAPQARREMAAPHPAIHDILAESYGLMGLPGAGDADRPGPGRLQPGVRRPAAPRHGQEDPLGDGRPAQIFCDGATERRVDAAKASEIFDLMAKFARPTGFNNATRHPMALVAYQTAWMKANHPVAFIAACMSLAITNTTSSRPLRQEAARMGIRDPAA